MTIGGDTKKVAAIMAHRNDEVLGCGGSLARLSRSGASVHIFIQRLVSHHAGRQTKLRCWR